MVLWKNFLWALNTAFFFPYSRIADSPSFRSPSTESTPLFPVLKNPIGVEGGMHLFFFFPPPLVRCFNLSSFSNSTKLFLWGRVEEALPFSFKIPPFRLTVGGDSLSLFFFERGISLKEKGRPSPLPPWSCRAYSLFDLLTRRGNGYRPFSFFSFFLKLQRVIRVFGLFLGSAFDSDPFSRPGQGDNLFCERKAAYGTFPPCLVPIKGSPPLPVRQVF